MPAIQRTILSLESPRDATQISEDKTMIQKKVVEDHDIVLPSYPADIPDVNPDYEDYNETYFPPKIHKITDQVYSAVGYGLANSIMVIGPDGVIIIDAMMSDQSAEQVMKEFREITDKPVKAIVYTHSHPDHINGAGIYEKYSDGDLEIYAHSTLLDNYYRESGYLGKLTQTRGVYYYGAFLPQEGPDRFVNTGIGPFLETGDVTTSFIHPNITFDEKLETEVAGLKMVLISVPSETNDEIVVWFPELEVLASAEVLYKQWPNLYSIRGTIYRDVETWINSLQVLIDLDAKYMVPSHTTPVSGYDEVKDVLTAYHDGVQYIFDQTIRGINQGKTADELAHSIELPDSLVDHEWLQERYNERPWHVRNIYGGMVGWFQGDGAFLSPISEKEQSMKIIEAIGGSDVALQQVRDAIDNREWSWAAILATHILNADPENEEAKLLKAHALHVLGKLATNSGARNWYITQALILEEKINLDPNAIKLQSTESIMATPIDLLLKQTPTRVDPTKAVGLDIVVGLDFTDTEASYTFHIRNSIAALTPGLEDDLDIKLITDEATIKLTLAGQKMLQDSIDDGSVIVEGSRLDATNFISIFDPYVIATDYAN